MELQEELTPVSEVAEASIRLVQQCAEHENVRLVNTLGDDHRTIFIDVRRVKQILVNLLSNAINFTPENGEVALGANIRKDGCFVLSVTDAGIGMDAAGLATGWRCLARTKTNCRPCAKAPALACRCQKA